MPQRRDLPPMSLVFSKKRTSQMNAILGSTVTTRIVSLALYLLGASIKELSMFVDAQLDTVKALVKRTLHDGLPALEDRRSSASEFLPRGETKPDFSCKLLYEDEVIWIAFDDKPRIKLRGSNPIQNKTILLTLLDAGLLSIGEVARTIGLSQERTRKLCKALVKQDVQAVMDKRQGQQKEYLFTPEVKSELIQQFALNVLSGWPTTGRAIADDLQERCEIVVSERSVRLQLNKLGLSNIADSLPELLAEQKKTSPNS